MSELKVVNDVTDRASLPLNSGDPLVEKQAWDALPNPETERSVVDVLKGIERALLSINQKLDK